MTFTAADLRPVLAPHYMDVASETSHSSRGHKGGRLHWRTFTFSPPLKAHVMRVVQVRFAENETTFAPTVAPGLSIGGALVFGPRQAMDSLSLHALESKLTDLAAGWKLLADDVEKAKRTSLSYDSARALLWSFLEDGVVSWSKGKALSVDFNFRLDTENVRLWRCWRAALAVQGMPSGRHADASIRLTEAMERLIG